VNIGTATGLESRRAGQLEEQIERLYTDVFPGQALPPNPPTALRKEISAASARAEFLGVYRGNLSALDLLTEISKLVPKQLDVVFDELSIDRQIAAARDSTSRSAWRPLRIQYEEAVGPIARCIR